MRKAHREAARELYEEAKRLNAKFGWTIFPVIGKKPAVRSWEEFQTRPPTADELRHMFSNKRITGIAVIAASRRELVIVNIVGPIDLDKLSHLYGHFGIPDLDIDIIKKP